MTKRRKGQGPQLVTGASAAAVAKARNEIAQLRMAEIHLDEQRAELDVALAETQASIATLETALLATHPKGAL